MKLVERLLQAGQTRGGSGGAAGGVGQGVRGGCACVVSPLSSSSRAEDARKPRSGDGVDEQRKGRPMEIIFCGGTREKEIKSEWGRSVGCR